MRNKFLVILLIFTVATTLHAQSVQKVSIGDNQNYGITYTLPKSVVQLKAKATMTKTEAGVFAPYAEKYLGLTDVALVNQTQWELNSVSLELVAMPDESKTYHIQFPEKGDATVLSFRRWLFAQCQS